MANFNWPINPTTVNSGPIQIEINGIPDTIDPVLGVFMPSQVYDSTGALINPATEETLALLEAKDFATETTSQQILAAIQAQDYASNYSGSIRVDYTATNITNVTWVEILADSGPQVSEITLFDGGGFAMELGFGAAAAEVRNLLIPPGGFNGKFTFHIPANTRLSLRAVGSALVNAGELDINLFV